MGFGTFPFGTSLTVGSLEVATAVAVSNTRVRVEFTQSIDLSHAQNFDAANYAIDGLTVSSVAAFGGLVVMLETTVQLPISYTLIVNTASDVIRSVAGDFLDPLHAVATFLGHEAFGSFTATAQSRRKVRVTFDRLMMADGEFLDPENYELRGLGGQSVPIDSVRSVGPDASRAEVILAADLVPFAHYSLRITDVVRTSSGGVLLRNQALFQWQEVVPRPIRVRMQGFSGEVSGGLLGRPAGQVFVSPAFGASVPSSVLEVAGISVCTRAFDVYTIPSLHDPVLLYTYPPPGGTTSMLGALGGVLWASAHRLGLAVMNLADLQEDVIAPLVDYHSAMGLLTETIDITRASFLNDARWRLSPGTGAALGAFCTASNLSPIGPGFSSGYFSIHGPLEPG